MTLAGIDGCKDGWLVVWDHDGATAIECIHILDEILQRQLDIAVIDIPIGLPDIGTRDADHCARTLLKKRACCVFTAPIRPILGCTTYDLARKCRLTLEDKSITRQAWAIVRKVKEADALLTPELQKRLREGHPEISFALMNGGEPLLQSKHSTAGQQARLKLLSAAFPHLDLSRHSRAVREDVLDAHAMLWTARRIHKGNAVAFPEKPAPDSRGLSMQIWA